MRAPARTTGNYRAYGRADVNRLSFIRRSRDLGFSLDQVRSLLRLSDDRDRSCAEVDQIANAQLAQVRSKLANLSALHTTSCRILLASAGTAPSRAAALSKHWRPRQIDLVSLHLSANFS
jgi:DNA-binding transcriptional MerR regulator